MIARLRHARWMRKCRSNDYQGIRAYHSSPHDFDKFDLSKIGTGEGAQSATGTWLYFAGEPCGEGRAGRAVLEPIYE